MRVELSNPLVGSSVITRITVTDPETGQATDADSVDLIVQDPGGNETSETPTHPSTGVYQFPIDLDEPGWFIAIWTVIVGDLMTVKECQVCAAEGSLSPSPPSP